MIPDMTQEEMENAIRDLQAELGGLIRVIQKMQIRLNRLCAIPCHHPRIPE